MRRKISLRIWPRIGPDISSASCSSVAFAMFWASSLASICVGSISAAPLVVAASAAPCSLIVCSSSLVIDYLMWTPEIAREITSRWISAVPSKMS